MFEWLRRKKPAVPPKAQWPVVIDVGEGVRMHVGPMGIRMRTGSELPCWGYRTEGLARFGQQELIYAALRGSAEQPSVDPVHQTRAIVPWAAQGKLVGVGGMTQFGPTHPGLFGRKEFRGVAYAAALNLESAMPAGGQWEDYLAVIALTEEEIAAQQRGGMARVLARMGMKARFFPYPVWNDAKRATAIDQAFLEASAIAKTGAYAHIAGFAPMRDREGVRVKLGPESAAQFGECVQMAIEKDRAVVVPTTTGWERCVACMTWEPGAREPLAITASFSADGMQRMEEGLLGCYLMVAVAEVPCGVRMFEDGFGLMLSKVKARELIAAMQERRSMVVEGAEGMTLVCEVE